MASYKVLNFCSNGDNCLDFADLNVFKGVFLSKLMFTSLSFSVMTLSKRFASSYIIDPSSLNCLQLENIRRKSDTISSMELYRSACIHTGVKLLYFFYICLFFKKNLIYVLCIVTFINITILILIFRLRL